MLILWRTKHCKRKPRAQGGRSTLGQNIRSKLNKWLPGFQPKENRNNFVRFKKYMFYGIAFGAPTNTRTRSASMIGCGDGELLPFRCLRRVQGEGEGGP